MEQFPKINFTLKNICVKNGFALGGTNVLAVEWDFYLTNREGRDFLNSGVTTINVKRGRATLVRDYIFDHEVSKKSMGRGKRLILQMKDSEHRLTRCKRLRFTSYKFGFAELLLRRSRYPKCRFAPFWVSEWRMSERLQP